jgi:polysaccharide deacetylase 2 family uncharacterized protein YibQ
MASPSKKTSRASSAGKAGRPKGSAISKKRTRRKKKAEAFSTFLLAFAMGVVLCLFGLLFADRLGSLLPRSFQAATGEQAVQDSSGKAAGSRSGIADNDSFAVRPDEDAGGKAEAAVAGALIDLKTLPYEESLSASLDERIRQVDYALMQAAWLKKIPASAMRLVSVEDRLEGIQPYQYQIIDILPGKSSKEYADALKNSLAAWAEGAMLQDQGDNHWLIFIDGVQTHHIRLFPGRQKFLPLPGREAQRQPSAAPPLPGHEASDLSAPRSLAHSPPGSGFAQQPPCPGMGRAAFRASGEAARMVIVIDDLGSNLEAVQQLLELDYPVSLAFWPHGSQTALGASLAHQAGREILIHQPMQPLGYPRVNPGPNALLVGMASETIQKILDASVLAVPHAVGLNNHMGSRFTQNLAGVHELIAALKRHDLFALDSLTHSGSIFASEAQRLALPSHQRDVFLDVTASPAKIMKELRQAEHIALICGQSIAIGHPYPETLATLKEWQSVRSNDVRLVRLQDLQP